MDDKSVERRLTRQQKVEGQGVHSLAEVRMLNPLIATLSWLHKFAFILRREDLGNVLEVLQRPQPVINYESSIVTPWARSSTGPIPEWLVFEHDWGIMLSVRSPLSLTFKEGGRVAWFTA